MDKLVTHGRWIVKEGHEQAFIAAWSEFASWTIGTLRGGVEKATLLQSIDDSRVFSSHGAWNSQSEIDAWRGSDGFAEHFESIQQHLDSVEVFVMAVAAEA